jgi:hypothetical protein
MFHIELFCELGVCRASRNRDGRLFLVDFLVRFQEGNELERDIGRLPTTKEATSQLEAAAEALRASTLSFVDSCSRLSGHGYQRLPGDHTFNALFDFSLHFEFEDSPLAPDLDHTLDPVLNVRSGTFVCGFSTFDDELQLVS